jgi:lipopolysaccharide/colanic/teichoic acid biosynthesis glycosyltransferase
VRVECIAAAVGLTLCLPLLLIAAFAIVLTDGFPILFRQRRMGRGAHEFTIFKLRTMGANSRGLAITASNDTRVTPVGRILRKLKIDELPQLWNVVKGDMSLIGPRPEVPEYVDTSSPAWSQVLALRPGITDLTALVLRDEERLLSAQESPQEWYQNCLLPAKLKLSLDYSRTRTPARDLVLLFLTVRYSFLPVPVDPWKLAKRFDCEFSL